MNLAKKLSKAGLKKLPPPPKMKLKLRPEILLHPNIPKPLHGVNPRSIFGSSWWNKTRKACYASTDYHCLACGVHKDKAKGRQWMEAHEIYSIDYVKGIAVFTEVVPLCHYCHNYIHDGRLTDLLSRGELAQVKFVAIIKHGDSVLASAGLSRKPKFERDAELERMTLNGQVASWEDWRLIVDQVEYEPIYRSYDEWKTAHLGVSEE